MTAEHTTRGRITTNLESKVSVQNGASGCRHPEVGTIASRLNLEPISGSGLTARVYGG